ncbi:hypothetical protein JX265_001905 [Neoarthrinium moseri]|uniref:USP domain-containing protein n=1 Tax=Neoarthrinium moseri TaxID=1658444 RepID=A0A9P9WW12_9PEZI|nr:hypothetical protein JX265_001905 [Neoarthrinium moseri]
MSRGRRLAPIRVEAPYYPHYERWDLPTTGALNAGIEEVVRTTPPEKSLLVEAISSDTDLFPFNNDPPATCYRNAALVALFNISPFVNIIRAINDRKGGNNGIFAHLVAICNPFLEGDTPDNIQPHLNTFWDNLLDTGYTDQNGVGVRSWREYSGTPADGDDSDGAAEPQTISPTAKTSIMHDSTDLMWYLLDRLQSAIGFGLTYNGVSLEDQFHRLFRTQMVQRIAFSCDCKKKQRQPVTIKTYGGFAFNINVTGGNRTLSQTIAEILYNYNETRSPSICPGCMKQENAPSYFKFLYLPEVLFIGTNYQAINYTQDATSLVNFPELLDMSRLRDDINNPDIVAEDGKVNYGYRLQSIITFPRRNSQTNGHYIAYLRRSGDNDWHELNDVSFDKTVIPSVTRDDIMNNRTYRPRLLIYVRDRTLSLEDLRGDGVAINVPPEAASGTSAPPATLAPVVPPGPQTPSPNTGNSSDSLGYSPPIPTNRNDPRIEESRHWTLKQLNEVLKRLKITTSKKDTRDQARQKFLQHFQEPRNYNLYTLGRLKEVATNLNLEFNQNVTKAEIARLVTHYNQNQAWRAAGNGDSPPESPQPAPVTRPPTRASARLVAIAAATLANTDADAAAAAATASTASPDTTGAGTLSQDIGSDTVSTPTPGGVGTGTATQERGQILPWELPLAGVEEQRGQEEREEQQGQEEGEDVDRDEEGDAVGRRQRVHLLTRTIFCRSVAAAEEIRGDLVELELEEQEQDAVVHTQRIHRLARMTFCRSVAVEE